jgi:coenzyme F420 hydrogenase subunit beta
MRKPDSLEQIVDRHLCMGCGTCAAARPDLVTMVDTEQHGRRPRLKPGADPSATRALARLCPGREIRFAPPRDYDEAPELRYRGSSGGAVSALALHGIESGAAAGVVQVAARKDRPLFNETVISRSRQEILAAAASRYAPASPCEKLADVRAADGKHIFVGKPCDVAGAQRLMQSDKELRASVGLTISIFCAGTPSTAATKELIRSLNIDNDAWIEDVRYRGRGWPGRMAVRYRLTVDSPPKSASVSYEKGWVPTCPSAIPGTDPSASTSRANP